MKWKETKLYSMLSMTCPRCHEGKLFTDPNPYHFSKIFDMPDHCPKCAQKYLIEPGFFYGAMYVSYGVVVAYLVAIYVALMVLYPSFTKEFYLLTAIPSALLLTPYFFRISRAIYFNIYVHYDKNWKKDKAE